VAETTTMREQIVGNLLVDSKGVRILHGDALASSLLPNTCSACYSPCWTIPLNQH
jgi:hypothetical protein